MNSVSRDKQIDARTSFLPDCLLCVVVSFFVGKQIYLSSFSTSLHIPSSPFQPLTFVTCYIEALTIIHHTEAMIVVLSVINSKTVAQM